MRTRQEASLPHSLQADVPLDDPSQDAFDRRPFAEGVVRAIRTTPTSDGFVIGIHGPWGDGKSTVLNFIARDLRIHKVPVVRYNPWRFTDEDRMIAAFFEELATSAGAPRSKVRRLIAEYGSVVADVADIASDRAGKGARVAAKLSEKSLEARHDELLELMRARRDRTVVLVDDVDRLDKHELFALFRMIKASADLPGVVYVLAFDDAAVADALQERYGGRDPRAGRRFLEKIVQMPLALPPADPAALEREVRTGLDGVLDEVEIRLSDSDRVRFDQLFTVGVRQGMHTPRQVKQYLNACRFALAALKGEANPTDVLLVEALRVVYPGVHAGVRRSQEWFHGVPSQQGTGEQGKEVLASLLKSGLRQLPRLEREAVDRLLEGLFPRYGPEKLGMQLTPAALEHWRHERRVCSPAYCGRYFSYAVARTDVSDATIESLRSEAERPDSRVLPSLVAEILSPLRQEAGVERLERLVRDVSPPAAERLVRAVAMRSDSLAEPFSLDLPGVGMRCARVVASLIRRAGDGDNGGLSAWIFSESPAVWFAAAVFDQLDPPPPPPPGSATKSNVNPAVITHRREAMADRLELEAGLGLSLLTPGRRWRFELLFVWARCAGRPVVNNRYIPQIQGDRNIATALLKCVAQPLAAPGQIIPTATDLRPEHLKDLAEIIDIHAMHRSVSAHSISDLCFEPKKWKDLDIDRRLLSQFVYYIERGTDGPPVGMRPADAPPPPARPASP